LLSTGIRATYVALPQGPSLRSGVEPPQVTYPKPVVGVAARQKPRWRQLINGLTEPTVCCTALRSKPMQQRWWPLYCLLRKDQGVRFVTANIGHELEH